MRLEGTYVALVTPFKGGAVDYAALERLVDWHVEHGTDGLVPCGTTGESPTLTMEEHVRVIEFVVRCARGRIPVMAGTGANSTAEAIHLTAAAAKAGADSALLVGPYYNKPEPEGMYRHFRAVAEAADIPLVLYNIPSRTGREIALDTICRLAEMKSFVGLKAANGSTDSVTEVVRRTGLTVLSGDDSMTLPFMAVGARGVISVAANIAPSEVKALTDAFLGGDAAGALKRHLHLFPLFKVLFIESNPIPVKAAMHLMGMIEDEMRLPLSPPSEGHRSEIAAVLRQHGLLPRA